jgi:hypothetical protein
VHSGVVASMCGKITPLSTYDRIDFLPSVKISTQCFQLTHFALTYDFIDSEGILRCKRKRQTFEHGYLLSA